VAARPVAVGRRADVERHLEPVALIEARAAHFRELPAWPEIARAHFGVGFEASARKDHRLRAKLHRLTVLLHLDAAHGRAVVDERRRARVVEDFDAGFLDRRVEILDEPCAPARHLDRHAPEELALPVDEPRLAAVIQDEAHTFRAQPRHRIEALRNQRLG
jgi:hypothetical protein